MEGGVGAIEIEHKLPSVPIINRICGPQLVQLLQPNLDFNKPLEVRRQLGYLGHAGHEFSDERMNLIH